MRPQVQVQVERRPEARPAVKRALDLRPYEGTVTRRVAGD